jgi:restriction endonuclease
MKGKSFALDLKKEEQVAIKKKKKQFSALAQKIRAFLSLCYTLHEKEQASEKLA